jgi:RNA recognition motif-containing protein
MSDTEAATTTQTSSKRALEEIEIDLSQHAPLSKKQKRLLRKGKLDLDKKHKKEEAKQEQSAREHERFEEIADKPNGGKSTKFGVWVGNLSFDTSREDLFRYITAKTAEFEDDDDDEEEEEKEKKEGEDTEEEKEITDKPEELKLVKIPQKDILRVNLPTQRDSKKIKGFAYIDFRTKNQQYTTLTQLNETHLNGRNLLIKDSTSFEGRPEKPLSKNPPSRILFVGNLSFDTTDEMLTSHFQHCGAISKIRMATFEDSGKCKGFAFLDFKDEEGPTKALKDKTTRRLLGRSLRLEFGEDRSKKTPKKFQKSNDDEGEAPFSERDTFREAPAAYSAPAPAPAPVVQEKAYESQPKPKSKPFNKPIRERSHKETRPLASVALANAQRASAAIVKSTGKKISFD